MKIMFSLKVIIKVTFPRKKKLYYDNCFDLNYAPHFGYQYHCHPMRIFSQ